MGSTGQNRGWAVQKKREVKREGQAIVAAPSQTSRKKIKQIKDVCETFLHLVKL